MNLGAGKSKLAKAALGIQNSGNAQQISMSEYVQPNQSLALRIFCWLLHVWFALSKAL